MIEQIAIISLLVFAIHYTMQENEIFAGLGNWIEDHLPTWAHNPLYECPVCMCFWYGSVLYWIGYKLDIWEVSWNEWPFVVIGAMGLNAVLVKLFPDKQ